MKPPDDFYPYRDPRKQSSVCKECQKRRQRARYATDPEYREQVAARDRARRLGLEIPSFRKPAAPKRTVKDFPPRTAPEEDWQCVRCGETKPASGFYIHRDPRRQDYVCRACQKRAYSERYRSDETFRERAINRARARYAADPVARRSEKRVYYTENKEKFVAYAERTRERRREVTLTRRYGLSLAGYMQMLDAQGGRCAICAQPSRDHRPLHVDHNHSTSRIRALLCGRCNSGLGSFDDDAARLEVAVAYLRRFA